MKENKIKGIWIIALVIIICLIITIAGYIFFTKSVMYIYPATGQTENEILGQMGDYFGGIFNPIVGIISVVLLWLAYSAQKEELKKTSAALAEQINLSRDENSRIQIVEIINKIYEQHDSIFASQFKIEMNPPSKKDLLIFVFEQGKTYNLDEIVKILEKLESTENIPNEPTYSDIINNAFLIYDPTQPITYFFPVWLKIIEAKNNIEQIHSLSLDLIKVIHLKNIELIWFRRYYDALEKCKISGVLGDLEHEKLIQEMQDFRNEKFNS